VTDHSDDVELVRAALRAHLDDDRVQAQRGIWALDRIEDHLRVAQETIQELLDDRQT
jgi:hypothetical protein